MKFFMGRIVYLSHQLFPKTIPLMTCYGCLKDNCEHRTKKENKLCYIYGKRRIDDIR